MADIESRTTRVTLFAAWARRNGRNPDLPENLRAGYEAGWRELIQCGLREFADAEDSTLVSSIIGVLAMGKGQFTLGRLAVAFSEDESAEMLRSTGWI